MADPYRTSAPCPKCNDTGHDRERGLVCLCPIGRASLDRLLASVERDIERRTRPGLIVEHGQLGEAHFSVDLDREYRYLLTRPPAHAQPWWVTFVMLNPSTATHDQDDPTIAKCRKFARRICEEREGPLYRLGVRIVNVYAIRATDPRECLAHPKPIGGAANDDAIREACRDAAVVICAWGNHAKARGREVRAMLVGDGVRLWRLGKANKDGSPPHPLYLKDSTPLEPWT